MTEKTSSIPSRIKNATVGGFVTGAEDIDAGNRKSQKEVNQEVQESLGQGGSVDSRIAAAVNVEKTRAEGAESALDGRVDTLEDAVGTGGSVDSRISAAVNAAKSEIKGNATSACDTLGEAETLISAEATRAQAAETALDSGKADKATTLAGYGITDAYTKGETYSKTEINDHIDTPNQGYVTAIADSNTTTANLKSLIDTAAGSDKEKADFIYRVGCWDGSQYNDTMYSEYAWIDTDYVFLSKNSQIGEVFDISAYHANTPYVDLTAALGTNGQNIPQSLRKGGMSVKFIQGSAQSSDNKYVQYRLMADSWSINPNDWSFCGDAVLVENPEWIYVLLDDEKRILAGLKSDGSVEWSIGIPTPVKEYIDNVIAEIKNGTEGTDLNGLNKIIAFLSEFSTSDTLKDLLDTKVDKEEGKSLIDSEYAENVHFVENPEFIEVHLDDKDNILWAIKTDGSIYYGAGVPQQVIDYIEEKIADLSLDEYEDMVAFLSDYLGGDVTLKAIIGEWDNTVPGKKISILGDSISTFNQEGYKIDGYSMYYPTAAGDRGADVTTVNDTWWMQVINSVAGTLEVNASYSGSTASSRIVGFSPRVPLLGNPDIIYVALGTNDSGIGVTVGEINFDAETYDLTQFAPAYIKGMQDTIAAYPTAKIVCVAFDMGTDYQNAIKTIAEHYGAEYIYVGDISDVHPNKAEMTAAANRIIPSAKYATTTTITNAIKTLSDNKVDKEEGKSLINSEYAEGVDYENNPEYVHALTDKDKKIIIGVKKDSDVFFGTFPSQITKAITKSENETKAYADSKAGKDQKDNIIHRVRYTSVSDNMTETVDISNRQYDNVVYVGIFVSNYLHNNKFFNILGSEDGTIYTTILSRVQCNTVIKVPINSNIKYLRLVTTNISNDESFVVSFNVWNRYDGISLNVAANDSDSIIKTEAHFVCDGVNDEVELDEATVLSNWTGEIHLGNGIFYIDSFPYKNVNNKPIYSVMTNNNYYGQPSNKRIIGISKSTNDYGKGTRIFVRESAFEVLPEGIEPYVISGPGYYTTASLFIKDIDISVENNQHKIVCINGQNLGALWVDSCSLIAGANAFSSTLPAEGCVGLRGCGGDTNGTNYVLRNTYAVAFHVGFQLGGEHLVAYELGTRFCYYGYTFGEYDYGGASGGATDTHPLTLIHCCDEGSRAFPKFVRSGIYNQEAAATKQEIDLIGWSMEVHSAAIPAGAVEVTPGAFCGSISYAAYGYTNTSKNTQQPSRCNRVDVKFWANDQSGRYFKTTNAAHAEMGNTLERLGYWANIMQKYYDTDLNKMLVCTSSDNQEWRDFEGNIINDNN